MAYYGTTAATSLAAPPIKLIEGLGGVGGGGYVTGSGVWLYRSSDAAATVVGSNYFTDGKQLGMKVGDLVIGIVASSAGTTSAVPYMGCVGSVSTSGATLNTLTTSTG